MQTKGWGGARTIPTLPVEANGTGCKNNMTLWLQKRQATTYHNASASIFYLKAGTAAPKSLIPRIYRNMRGGQHWGKKKDG